MNIRIFGLCVMDPFLVVSGVAVVGKTILDVVLMARTVSSLLNGSIKDSLSLMYCETEGFDAYKRE